MYARINVQKGKDGKYRWNAALCRHINDKGNVVCQSTDPKTDWESCYSEAYNLICPAWEVVSGDKPDEKQSAPRWYSRAWVWCMRMIRKYLLLCIVIGVALLVSCTTDAPKLHRINGTTQVHNTERFVGIPVWTKVKEVKTLKQAKEDLAVEKVRRKQEIELGRQEKQEGFVFWYGVSMFVAAGVCVIMAVAMKGYIFWGSIAIACGSMGSLAFGFAHWIKYLKWGPVILAAPVLLWILRKFKDFSAKDGIQNLLNRTKELKDAPKQ